MLVNLGLRRAGIGITLARKVSRLFAAGEVGAWYDPSDLSTMFQDSAGTTPVTAAGDPVGLLLDKSKGLALGSELMVNGTFTGGGTDWTPNGWTFSGDEAHCVSGVGGTLSSQVTYAVAQRRYRISFTVTSVTSGTVTMQFGNVSGTTRNAPGTYTEDITAIATTTARFTVNAFTGSIDNVSVKEILGNHASQATSAARPLYQTDGTYHWLQFDGVDDSLTTAAIDFTATDKMSVFSGWRVSTDAAAGTIACLGGKSVLTGFNHQAPWSVSLANVSFDLGGNTGSMIRANRTAAPATLTSAWVMDRSLADYTVEHVVTNINNAPVTPESFSGSVTGSFGNHALGLGTVMAGNPLNGNIYSLIVRGALSTADEITSAEAYVNSKTGAY